MPTPPKIAAGLLMYRMKSGVPEIFLVHPGGPFWQNKDDGAWGLPKGETKEGETDYLEVARREFKEETGFDAAGTFVPLGTMKGTNKIVHVWAFEGDCDPAALVSNTCEIDWPPRSGKKMTIPEVDRGGFFSLSEARTKLNKYQAPIVDEFERLIKVSK